MKGMYMRLDSATTVNDSVFDSIYNTADWLYDSTHGTFNGDSTG